MTSDGFPQEAYARGRDLASTRFAVSAAQQLATSSWPLSNGNAGAATQAGASGAALIATGIAGSQALSVAVSAGALGVLSGSAIFLFAVAWRIAAPTARQRSGEARRR